MRAIQFLYACFLRLSGLGLVAVAFMGLVLPRHAEVKGFAVVQPVDPGIVLVAGILGLYLLVPWWLPKGLRRPAQTLDLFWTVPLTGASWLACAILISVLRTVADAPTDPIFSPSVSFAWAFGAMVSAVLIIVLVSMRSDAPEGGANDVEGDANDAEAIEAAEAAPAMRRAGSLRAHRIFLIGYGCYLLIVGLGLGAQILEGTGIAASPVEGTLLKAQISAAAGIAAGLSLIVGIGVPRAVSRPSRAIHFLAVGLWLFLLSGVATFGAMDPPPAVSDPTQAQAVIEAYYAAQIERLLSMPGAFVAFLASGISWIGLTVTTILMIRRPVEAEQASLRPYSTSTGSDVPRVAKKDVRAGRLPEPTLPALGAAMKLYVVADWIVLRLLGLGLLGAGYLLWRNIENGWVLPQIALSYGLEPMHALYAYGIVGGLLAIPFLLPRFVVAPRHVVGGLVKALVLLFAGFVLMPLIPLAIELLTEKKFHDTLNIAVPIVFKAVMGIAITSALILSFFRQLGHGPKTDYLGKPVIEMSEKELRRLREARMGINA